MAVLAEYVGTFVRELIFFSGDVKTTTIAIAVTSSVCCSVVWLLINLFNPDGNSQDQPTCQQKSSDSSQRHSVVSYHLNKKIHTTQTQRYRRNSYPATSIAVTTSLWTSRTVEKGCTVPCIRCTLKNADKMCRFVLCKICCQSNLATVCDYHDNTILNNLKNREDTCQLKPKQMDLSYLKLVQCPDRVGYVGSQLLHLNLSNNCLLSVPVEIGFLLGLQHLDLHQNRLSKLPESIRNLRNLQELDVRQNKLQNLPSSIGQLHKLQILKLKNNELKSLPRSIGQLRDLQQFKACDNTLEELPVELCHLSKLEVLKVRGNKLIELPINMNHMVRLTNLDVSENKLTSLPNDITKCAFLSSLRASQNRLHELPSHINRLQDLRELNVSNNLLRYLPASIHGLQLVLINLHKNPLWKECHTTKTGIAEKDCSSFPSLLELVSRMITEKHLQWRKHHLPLELEETLSRMHYCSSCERPLVDTYKTRLEFLSLNSMSHKLPLYQIICPQHYSSTCKFLDICDVDESVDAEEDVNEE